MTEMRVIAIDGAAGSGKSTLARGLAHALKLPYVNTGLMYRPSRGRPKSEAWIRGDAEALATR